jgi:regulator of sigma E protease
MSVIIFIIALAVLILVHEFGHFIVAKKSGIRVDEFGLGLPPRAWGKKFGETLYSLNWIPFGGFVKIFGEDIHEDLISEQDKPRSFYYKPKWIQSAVLVAGVTFNALFAWLLISVGFMIGFPSPVNYVKDVAIKDPHVVILQVLPESPAEKSGLKSGDTLLFVGAGNNSLQDAELTPEHISSLIKNSNGEQVQMLYRRGDTPTQTIFIQPKTGLVSDGFGVGISMDTIGTLKLPVWQALYEGGKTTIGLIKTTVVGLGTFLWNAVTLKADLSQVAGPVGIAGSVGEARQLGFVYLLSLVALISINLAVINLVPFPALDGGRLLFILIEVIIRRPIPPKIFQWMNAIGFALLILLMFVITGHDILKLLL